MSTRSNLVGSCHDGSASQVSNAVNRDHEMDVNVAVASKPKKRQAYRQGDSREWPIVIDDSVNSPKWTVSTQGPFSEKHRIKKKDRNTRRSFPTIHKPRDDFGQLKEHLQSSKKIVVISGAGISVNAGLPDFQSMRRSKQSSFHRSLYDSVDETELFHSTICNMYEHLHSDSNAPTSFHKAMDKMAREGRLLSHITQNIDCIEQRLPDLEAKTVRLHGQVDQARCDLCYWVCAFDPRLFQGAKLPDCQKCLARSEARVMKGRRSLRTGKLKPDVLLYDDPHPDDNEIIKVIKDSLAIRPDLVLIAGTKLRNLGAQSLAANFCHAARSVGGTSFWISKEAPRLRLESLCDYVLIGDCDKAVPLDIFKS